MMNNDYALKLGKQLGTGGAVKNFLRVRVEYPLAKPLKAKLKIRVEGKISTLNLKYENVPNFCFGCGTIGHAQTGCPEEDGKGMVVRYGTDLRASPLKCTQTFKFSIPAAPAQAARALNFVGAQKEKVLAASRSADSSSERGKKARWGREEVSGRTPVVTEQDKFGVVADIDAKLKEQEDQGGREPAVPQEVSNALESGVQKMQVDENKIKENSSAYTDESKYRVSMSGDYHQSGPSTSIGTVPPRFLKSSKSVVTPLQNNGEAGMEIDRHVEEGLEELASSAAKWCKKEDEVKTLVGAHGEPHQAQ